MEKEIKELLLKNGYVLSHSSGYFNGQDNMWFLKQGVLISVHIEDADDEVVEDLFYKEEIAKSNK